MLHTFLKENKRIIVIFLVWWIVINSFAFLSLNRFDLGPGKDSAKPQPEQVLNDFYAPPDEFDNFVGMHTRRLSRRYLDVAENGYNEIVDSRYTNIVNFPVYPLSIRYLGTVFKIDYKLAGFLISNIALFISVLVFYRLVQFDFSRRTAQRSVWYLLIFPTAFFFTMVYTESLFFLLSLLVFYFALQKKWLMCGIIGFLAAATRVQGVLLFIPILWEYFHQEKKAKPNIVPLALIPAGLASFFLYHYLRTGDLFAFLRAQQNWDRKLFDFGNFFNFGLSGPEKANFYLEAFFVLILLAVCFLALNRMRTSYFIYLIMSIAIPLLTGTFESMARYGLVIFPVYILLGQLGKNRDFDRVYTFVSVLLLALSTILIVNYFWIA